MIEEAMIEAAAAKVLDPLVRWYFELLHRTVLMAAVRYVQLSSPKNAAFDTLWNVTEAIMGFWIAVSVGDGLGVLARAEGWSRRYDRFPTALRFVISIAVAGGLILLLRNLVTAAVEVLAKKPELG